jgi:hypothetical protein
MVPRAMASRFADLMCSLTISPAGGSAGMRHSAAGKGTGSTLRCYRQRGTRTVRLLRNKKSQERKPGNANAGHPDRHEKARSELTGTAGSHTSSAPRVRHCWLADIDLAAFVRHNHAMSWTAGDDTGRLYGPRAHPRDHGGAIDCGSRRTCFPTFYHDATLAD